MERNLEREDDVEVDKGDKRGMHNRILVFHEWRIYPYLKLYDPDNETFPIPVKYVDLMRQTQTSTNSVSEPIINDIWTEAKGINFSKEWAGTTRFHILRTRLPEGYMWVTERPMTIPKPTRGESIWSEAWTQLSRNGQTKITNCK